jgi:hypothetical protein
MKVEEHSADSLQWIIKRVGLESWAPDEIYRQDSDEKTQWKQTCLLQLGRVMIHSCCIKSISTVQ